jgi:hypothetical protein
MAQPFPPQGGQKQHTERPLKIYAEQYLEGEPVPIGVVIDAGEYPGGLVAARVHLATGAVLLVPLGAWVISSRYSGLPIEVISDEEFSERFGGGGGPSE